MTDTDLTTMLPTFVRCRTFGHAWDDVDPTSAEQDDHNLLFGSDIPLIVTRCYRCDMRRLDVINKTGGLVQRRYQYPSGYLMAKGQHRPKRAEFRLQLLALRVQSIAAKRGKK